MTTSALEVYGQVNRGVLWAGDGEDSQTFFVGNDNSATRFGLEGTADVSDAVGFNMTIGANIEVGLESESSNDVEIGDQAPDGDDFDPTDDLQGGPGLFSGEDGRVTIYSGDL